MKFQPLAEAVKSIGKKTPVGSLLSSKEWEDLPTALRNSAQFSARVENLKLLQRIQDGVGEIVGQLKPEGVTVDRSKLIEDIMKISRSEGLVPAGPGIADITSSARAALIADTQVEMAYGYANWKAAQDPDALEAFPAQRLTRLSAAKVPRDWEARWADAGAAVGWNGASQSEMVALKTSPIWIELSRFKNPWPPFDYNSGMWVDDVSHEDAVELGLLAEYETPEPMEEEFTKSLQADVSNLSPTMLVFLRESFGNAIKIGKGIAEWIG
jgi:hypothetical protein